MPLSFTGETGTGKEVLARGVACQQPTLTGLAWNCAAVSESLFETVRNIWEHLLLDCKTGPFANGGIFVSTRSQTCRFLCRSSC